MSEQPQFHLASSSPRRRSILETLGFVFTSGGVAADEARLEAEAPAEMVVRLASKKAQMALGERSLVLGADTAVVVDEWVLGKPTDGDDAVEMLMSLSGRTHRVLTGVALCSPAGCATAISSTDVRFRQIERDEAVRYWHSGEPADKAGGYGIQGVGGMFVEAISGSYSGVVGMPVFETVKLLRAAGIDALANRPASN